MATQTATDKAPAKPGNVPATQKAAAPTISGTSKSITDMVESSISQMVMAGKLVLPPDYAVANALKSAYLMLQTVENRDHKKALEVCTRESVANALLDMVVQGLNVGKDQGYFIVFGNQLVFMRSYMGAMAVVKMVNPAVKDFAFAVVYEGDVFKYSLKNGQKTVVQHEQELANIDKANILAAYAIALDKDNNPIRTEISTIDEIHQAWKQSRNNPFDDKGDVKESSTHGKFASDMAQKTVINKLCKFIINSSSDNTLLKETVNKTYEVVDAAAVKAEISDAANAGPVLEIPAETITETAQAAEQSTQPEKSPPPAGDGQLPLTGATARKPGF